MTVSRATGRLFARVDIFQRVGNRIKLINKLMAHFPGAGGNRPFNEPELKRIFYNEEIKVEDRKWQRVRLGMHLLIYCNKDPMEATQLETTKQR